MARMCGLCGVVALDRPPEEETVARMAASLAHRGPDGDGSFAAEGVALAHRRLAIIDLSKAGLQPMADGGLQLLHNGEIYNYLELRAELESRGARFRTATDTEVILAAYREWGDECVERFNGMWAFALWDGERRRLLLSRDRFGVKPLYYHHDGGRLVFASELKAFRAAGVPLRANDAAVRAYLELGVADGTEDTFFAGIRQVPPAHTLALDDSGVRIGRYWQLEPHEPPADPVGAVRELFIDSVRLRLRSDVPIGTCLSGGIDSSAIACTVSHLLRTEAESARPVGERQRTFTAWFQGLALDERPYAQAVVSAVDAEPHWVSFSATDVVAALPAIVEAHDEPFGSTSIVAQWWVLRAAKEAGLKVMLDGQGGDEVFAGYPAFLPARLGDLLAAGRIRAAAAELAAGGRRAPLLLGRALLSPPAEDRVRARLSGSAALLGPGLPPPAPRQSNGAPFPDRLRRRLYATLTTRGLPELLHSEDRNSMAHSLEARVPFLDYRLVELAFSLEGGDLIDRGRTKAVLRRALGDLIPPVVRDRRDKLGFVTPEAVWLRGPLGELAADVFASRAFAERGFVDAPAARRRLERHRSGSVNAGFELWRALNLELWARTFLDR